MTRDEVQHIANIAMLEFSEEDLDQFARTFSETMAFMDRIKEIDTGDTPSHFYLTDKGMETEEDEIQPGLSQEEALQNTKTAKYGYFEMTKYVE